MNWKVIAIIFIVLFTCETTFFIWSINLAMVERRNTNECYYEICSENYQAEYREGACICYNLDNFGNYVVNKTKIMS